MIAALGNPGPQYARTRHNIGWMILEEWCARDHLVLSRTSHQAIWGAGTVGSIRCLAARPLTYMNRSGQAVAALSHYYRIPADRVLVVCDDLNLPLGKIRLRPGGSDGGHNGLKSVQSSLGTPDFPRLRFGIGAPGVEERREAGTVDHVLQAFSQAEFAVLKERLPLAADALTCWLEQGIEAAMNRYNAA